MIWRAGVARFRAGAQAAISVQSPDSGLRNLLTRLMLEKPFTQTAPIRERRSSRF
jgi:hypothetical protein